jgi:DNA-binding transcriptional MerR regulator
MSHPFSITDLAAEFSVTTRTLRFYEEKSLLNPIRDGQKRWYSSSDRTRLKLVLRGKRLGLTLQESSEIIAMYDPQSSNEQQLLALIEKIRIKREDLERQRHDLDAMIGELDEWLDRYEAELSSTNPSATKPSTSSASTSSASTSTPTPTSVQGATNT